MTLGRICFFFKFLLLLRFFSVRVISLLLFFSGCHAFISPIEDSCEAPTAPNKWPLITLYALLSHRKLDFRPDSEFRWLFSLPFFSALLSPRSGRSSHHCQMEWAKNKRDEEKEIGSFAWRHLTISQASSRHILCASFYLLLFNLLRFPWMRQAIKRHCASYSNERHIFLIFISFDRLIQFMRRIQVKPSWRYSHQLREKEIRALPLPRITCLQWYLSSESSITGWTMVGNVTDASNDWLLHNLPFLQNLMKNACF